ncbi:hypothetical protein [Flavobacterium litorale]|uniref:ABC transporter permease n=1 Tax=Flavobacterium litorale TaxID=2856519 RepID=A0ABX8V3T1_9FLAO|nr:hypothetical protein [Flavobacterium litorale]QYJ67477.1 hypothetical protein K1I41_07895 [Flavobacterium litorale]
MFQLYKKRNFNSLMNDTFMFFRMMGKDYFGNFIKIAGGILLVLLVLVYLAGDIYFESIFTSGVQGVDNNNILTKYFDDNLAYFITIGCIIALLIVIITAISYAFPVVYLKLLENKKNTTTKAILKGLKSNTWKIIKFLLFSLFTFLPIATIVLTLSALLIVILIGIPIVIIMFAFINCWISLAFYDYLNNNSSYFEAMGNAWKAVFSNFWTHVGVTTIFYVIVYTVQSIISVVVYIIIGAFTMMSSNKYDGSSTDTASTLGQLLLISTLLSVLLSYLLNNLIMVNQGIIYYSAREADENNSLHADIDLIGNDLE